MAWLVRDGEVLARLEVATTLPERSRGLLGGDGIDVGSSRSLGTCVLNAPSAAFSVCSACP